MAYNKNNKTLKSQRKVTFAIRIGTVYAAGILL